MAQRKRQHQSLTELLIYLQLLLICAQAFYHLTNWQGKVRRALLASPLSPLFNALNIKLCQVARVVNVN